MRSLMLGYAGGRSWLPQAPATSARTICTNHLKYVAQHPPSNRNSAQIAVEVERWERHEAAKLGQDVNSSSDFHFAVNGKPTKVPSNSYFVMGDDRDNSLDGRAWGFVPRDLVIGRAMFVYWSYDDTQPLTNPIDFSANSRWRRTGTMVR